MTAPSESSATTPVKIAKLTPASDQQGVQVEVDELSISDLPRAMDKMGWTVSAQLMRHWLSIEPAWVMPENWRWGDQKDGTPINYIKLPTSRINSSIVKMAWAMRYPQVVEAMTHLRAHWNTPDGVKNLRKKLIRNGWQRGAVMPIGNVNMPAPRLDYLCQMNALPFGKYLDRLDDFYGAIFKATLKVAVVGVVYHDEKSGRDMIDVTHLGFYLRDTYDFNAGWFEDGAIGLGVWNKERCLGKAEMLAFKALSLEQGPAARLALYLRFRGFVAVSNADFRRWQKDNGSGGDFFVFSDVLWEAYDGPATEIPA